jgi:outer membrane protein OmpA-like peptidoglycan-associated protein
MKSILLLLLIAADILFCCAQNAAFVYKNDFDNPIINEKPVSNEDHRIELKDGFMFCEQMKENFYWCIAERLFVNEEKDFEIEARMRPYNYNSFASEFGIVFGLKDVNVFNSFTINSWSFSAVNSVSNYSSTPLIRSVRTNSYTYGDWCVFKIIYKSGIFEFYINEQLAGSCKKTEIPGRWFGWYTNGKMGLQLDYFYVRQYKGEIQVSDEARHFVKERIKGGVNTSKDEVTPRYSKDGSTLMYGSLSSGDGSFYSSTKSGDITCYRAVTDTSCKVISTVRLKTPLFHPWYIAQAPNDEGFLVGEKDNFFPSSGYPITCIDPLLKINSVASIQFETNTGINIRHASISNDGQVMLLSGYEKYEPFGMDLYVSFKKEKLWTLPKKIITLQTRGDELTPSISPDNKKIYFSSDGFPGYGFTDVFVSTRLDDSWLNWSSPKNLGRTINDEAFNEFFIAPDSHAINSGVMSSTYGNINNLDIFRVKNSRQKIKPKIVLTLFLKYTKPETEPVSVLQMNSDKTANPKFIPIPSDQKATIEIQPDEHFTFVVPDTSYLILNQNYFTKNVGEKIIELTLSQITAGESFILENIYFEPNQYQLLPQSFTALNNLADMMKHKPTLKIEVQGHTSMNQEGESFNIELSQKRANAVRNYLIAKNISSERITAKGYGYHIPIYKDDSEEHQSKNRRVEIKITDR